MIFTYSKHSNPFYAYYLFPLKTTPFYFYINSFEKFKFMKFLISWMLSLLFSQSKAKTTSQQSHCIQNIQHSIYKSMIVFAYCLNDIFFHNFNGFGNIIQELFTQKREVIHLPKQILVFFLFMFNNIILNTIALQ